jgi:hypothetical protein
VFEALLTIHIFAGTVALLSAIAATATVTFGRQHKWHVISGRVFVSGMAGVVVSAIPITLMKSNYALLMISIFSGYLVSAGWRFAKNRTAKTSAIDWVRVGVMAVTSIVLVTLGVKMILGNNLNGITLSVFGVIGAALCAFDVHAIRTQRAKGKTRIAYHLTMMLSGVIAATTAFFAVTIRFRPAFVVWLAPTVLITPVIIWWNARVEKGRGPRGMPEKGTDGEA